MYTKSNQRCVFFSAASPHCRLGLVSGLNWILLVFFKAFTGFYGLDTLKIKGLTAGRAKFKPAAAFDGAKDSDAAPYPPPPPPTFLTTSVETKETKKNNLNNVPPSLWNTRSKAASLGFLGDGPARRRSLIRRRGASVAAIHFYCDRRLSDTTGSSCGLSEGSRGCTGFFSFARFSRALAAPAKSQFFFSTGVLK